MRGLKGMFAMVAVLGTVAASGCSDSNDPYGNGNQNQTVLSGTIEGSPWAALAPLAARSGSGTVTVSVFGTDAQSREISITISGITTTGPYAIGTGGSATTVVSLELGTQVWPGLAGSTGSVTITEINATRMVGSFNATLQPAAGTGASGTRTVTGTFTAYFGQT